MRNIIPLVFTSLILGAPAVALTVNLQDRERFRMCRNNLSQLWKMANNYMVEFGGSHKIMPVETGDAFWLKFSSPETPLIDAKMMAIYQCPIENFDDKGCDYRGPAGNVNRYKNEDAVGADVDGNHGIGKGGNVLRVSGDVQATDGNDRLWDAAII